MNLPISQLCDKKAINIAQSQVGFINFLVLPVFQEFSKMCTNLQPLIHKAEANRKKWEELKDTFEQHREASLLDFNCEEIGGIDGDYFSYENYLRRKFKQNTSGPPALNSLQQSHATAHFSNNQRPSFKSRKSSILKIDKSLLNDNNQTGAFLLLEEEMLNRSSSSVSE